LKIKKGEYAGDISNFVEARATPPCSYLTLVGFQLLRRAVEKGEFAGKMGRYHLIGGGSNLSRPTIKISAF